MAVTRIASTVVSARFLLSWLITSPQIAQAPTRSTYYNCDSSTRCPLPSLSPMKSFHSLLGLEEVGLEAEVHDVTTPQMDPRSARCWRATRGWVAPPTQNTFNYNFAFDDFVSLSTSNFYSRTELDFDDVSIHSLATHTLQR